MTDAIPENMRAVLLQSHQEDAIGGLSIAEVPVPKPDRGQVLVRIEGAPCNPSDVLFLKGCYASTAELPTVPGREGAGRVVAAGGGLLARLLLNRRVACGSSGAGGGTWAQYFLANATDCIPLKRKLRIRQAASLIVNPLTAAGLLEQAKADGHRAGVQTAAASQVGRMLFTLAQEKNFPLVGVVRRQEQVELLHSLGAEHVLNSSAADFPDQLHQLCEQLQVTAAFDAVGGSMAGTLLSAMPGRSCVYLYGALSGEECQDVDPIQVIFHEKQLRGFYLAKWLQSRGPLRNLRQAWRLQQLMIQGKIQTRFQSRVSFDEFIPAIGRYLENMTEGKILLTPQE